MKQQNELLHVFETSLPFILFFFSWMRQGNKYLLLLFIKIQSSRHSALINNCSGGEMCARIKPEHLTQEPVWSVHEKFSYTKILSGKKNIYIFFYIREVQKFCRTVAERTEIRVNISL